MLQTIAAPKDSVLPVDHPPVSFGRIGVLIVNLGTPDATDYWSMRRYLKEFLSDRRVIEVPRAIWWPVLNLIILSVRPGRKGRDYDTIWNKERNEGPLKTITRAQAEKLAEFVAGGSLGDPSRITVDWAMRYGNPSMASRIEALQKQGCERILLVPLYPQYAAATTATVCDKAFDALKKMRWQPILRVAPPWHDDATYIDALAQSIEQGLAKLDFEPEVILASYHGVPREYLDKGDPYHCHCMKTTRLLRDRLGMSADKLITTFQSRFGPAEWLRPYTDETIKGFPGKGVKRIAVVTPGFVADCLETIEEIGIENHDYFLEHGGEKFARIDCLNDSPGGMRVLEALVARELSGWV
ncbi:MAG: ferrochelatase [Hyphomicrobiales bacterium]|nr:ferrochelatase [Hyphomicrobiales bacterium]